MVQIMTKDRNNLCIGELSKQFNWGIYSEEHQQSIRVSSRERELNKKHKQESNELAQPTIILNDDDTTIKQSDGTRYHVEKSMPFNKTRRLDLYFNNSELTTSALLNCAYNSYVKTTKNIVC